MGYTFRQVQMTPLLADTKEDQRRGRALNIMASFFTFSAERETQKAH